jgi:sugar lactone lactonase YvrE
VKWIKGAKEGIVVAGEQGQGNSLTQLSNPSGIVVDLLGTVYVADYSNKRVMRWLKGAKEGSVIISEISSENNLNQLSNPSGLSLDQWGNLYVTNGHRVQKFNINSNSNT